MPKTISADKLKIAKKVIETEIEPKLKQIIDNLNSYLITKSIRIGMDFTWFVDELTEEDIKNEKNKKTS